MKIIPAIDLIDGQCVRLHQGDYGQKKIYAADPLAMAKTFEQAGLRHLHVVDLDGAKAGHPVHTALLKQLVAHTSMQVDVGGGIRNMEHIRELLEAGVHQVNLGSQALRQPEFMILALENFGAEKIILSADVKGDFLAISGWQETLVMTWETYLTNPDLSALRHLCVTDIALDGTLSGPALGLYERITHRFPHLELIASGGVSSLEDLPALAAIPCAGVIIGKAIYEGRISLAALATYQAKTHVN